jgi:hypothetical protein
VRRSTVDDLHPLRFRFLLTAGLVCAIPPVAQLIWQGSIGLTAEASHEPGYMPLMLLSLISSFIGSFFVGVGSVFLFGVPAIDYLKRNNREGSVVACAVAMFLAACGIWIALFGLSMLSLMMTIGEPPTWDYWPTQEAVIALAALAVGGLIAGVIYASLHDADSTRAQLKAIRSWPSAPER